MATKVITGKVRASFVNVFEPKSINGSEPKYSCSLIIPKTDVDTLKKINAAIEEAKQNGIPKWGGKVPPNLKLPLRDGDIDRPDDEAYRRLKRPCLTCPLTLTFWMTRRLRISPLTSCVPLPTPSPFPA